MTALTPQEAIAWGQDGWRQFNLTWEMVEDLPGVHLRGRTENQSGILDITLDPEARTVTRITIVAPIKPEYTPLMVYTLATIANARMQGADTFFAQVLDQLSRKRLSQRVVKWGMWRVEVSTVAHGLLTVVIDPWRA